ncbi:hypothetical protein EO087_01755 [Dyella sp. M7H15-1]|uniref:helix-turn-helix domain-containing protein n=1 Tax=Dyella sp. M7H15-1 TaxID=2501295 RepID=UPI00100500A5|nr:helix-turn-helix domain-containing protein [Dyella sp. M7H15-1]QAU22868.1 hypothetical protein EO087_01755 [Dyella sp. M7H15-1]
MDAKTYFLQADGKLSRKCGELRRVAGLCKVTPYYLYMVISGHKTASPELAANLEHATKGQVDRRITLPDFPWDPPEHQKAGHDAPGSTCQRAA